MVPPDLHDAVYSGLDRLRVEVAWISDKNATACQLVVPGYGKRYTGSSKRAKGELHMPDVGKGLALGRALANAGRDIIRKELEYVEAGGWNCE
jgi:hypothetical protein